jgi:hypothetical protein
MNETYDLVIVGGGPAGLTLAQRCSKLDKKILIIEREDSVGGCHRVRRVNGLFTEHGPRIYSTTYVVFQELLKDMGHDFKELFTEYNFGIGEIGGQTVFSTLSFKELLRLGFDYTQLIVNDNHGRYTLLQDYLKQHEFSAKSYDMIDRVCKLTDGGGADKFTLNEFLQIVNQQFFYPLYQPKKPHDEVLFKIWREFLEDKHVEFMTSCTIRNIVQKNNKIESLTVSCDNSIRNVYCDKIVFAVPPINLYSLLTEFRLSHSWGDLEKFSRDTAYIDYICVVFHWDKYIPLKKVYGFPYSSWGVAFIVLSQYMTFEESYSKTVMSTAVTIQNAVSPNNNKTANQCNAKELVDEIFLQLKQAFGPDLPEPTVTIISPGVKYDEINEKWVSIDTAFITSSLQRYLPFHDEILTNMYNLGTHNGKSLYKFTSMESAVTNAVYLSSVLYPELKGTFIISKSISLNDVLRLFILSIIVYLIVKHR